MARFGGKSSSGKALLESDHVLFRGDFRVKAVLSELADVAVAGDELRLATPAGALALALGAAEAAKWADRIRNPPSRLAKLGVKAGMRVTVLGVRDENFLAELAAAGADVSKGRHRKGTDVVFLGAEASDDLARIANVEPHLARDGGVWVVTPRGVPALKDTAVMAAGKAAGLVDVKVARFSETHTALKFVIPKARR